MGTYNERLLAELKNIRKSRGYKYYAYPTEKRGTLNLKEWICGFPGTEMYEGGYFQVKLFFKDDYPFKPPVAQFVHPMFHPNIYTNGAVCLSILSSKWKPQMSIYSVLSGLQQLLNNPNTNSPSNAEPARLFVKNKGNYAKQVQENIKKHHKKEPWYKTE